MHTGKIPNIWNSRENIISILVYFRVLSVKPIATKKKSKTWPTITNESEDSKKSGEHEGRQW